MDLIDLPQNKAVCQVSQEIVNTFDRINQDWVVNIGFNPKDGNEIIRTHIHAENGSVFVKYINTDFWSITLDKEVFPKDRIKELYRRERVFHTDLMTKTIIFQSGQNLT